MLYEVLLQAVQQPAHHVVELVNQGDGDIAEGLWRAFLDVRGVVLRTIVCLTIFLYLLGTWIVYGPLFQVAGTEVVLVVQQGFLHTGAGHAQQFYLSLGRGGGRRTTLCDVLFS